MAKDRTIKPGRRLGARIAQQHGRVGSSEILHGHPIDQIRGGLEGILGLILTIKHDLSMTI